MHHASPHGVFRWIHVAAALAAALVLLSGCTNSAQSGTAGPTASAAASESANDADLHFAESMPGHHDQAIEMSKMLLDKPGVDPEIVDIAEGIQAAHQTQLDIMGTWSDTWAAGPAAPHTDDSGQNSSHHGGQGGLLTERQMEELDLADAGSAQRLYLDGMIRHHQGALALAAEEVKDGKHKEAVSLAQTILDTHPDEITIMTGLKATL